MKKVFIDGSAGTTGLRIRDRLAARRDVELLELPEETRKDEASRERMYASADIVFLCLPDDAARAACLSPALSDKVVIDTSTAHRTAEGWVYGFPEIGGAREKIAHARRIANPGCHASGFIALVAPLVAAGALKADAKLTCFSLTGFSGGGKKMIADYGARADALAAPRAYGLSQTHKHLPEMAKVCALAREPVFCPIVSSYYAGMEVTVPLFADDLSVPADALGAIYAAYYRTPVVHFEAQPSADGFLSADALAGRDDMEISVAGNAERVTLTARFDNLGKGASGAAVQNMNIVLGVDETTGLVLPEVTI